MGLGCCSPELKYPMREADHLYPSIEVKNESSHTSTSPCLLVFHRDSVYFSHEVLFAPTADLVYILS